MKLIAITTVALTSALGIQACGPTVGGTPVPRDLHCEEDEVIGFHGVPDDLICLNVDDLVAAENARRGAR